MPEVSPWNSGTDMSPDEIASLNAACERHWHKKNAVGSSSPPTSLVPIETPVDGATHMSGITHSLNGSYTLFPATPLEQNFRHRSWSARRAKIEAVIAQQTSRNLRLERWQACGGQAQVYWHIPDRRHVVFSLRCHDRFCWPCAKARSNLVAKNLQKALGKQQPRFVTLTLRANTDPLTKQIDRLYLAYRTLRYDPWWKKKVTAAASFCEITLNPETRLWHPHLHPLVCGDFLPQSVLARKWLGVTGDSPIAHIKMVPDTETVCRYVCKYASKPMDDSVFDDQERLAELVYSLKGRRLCLATGTMAKAGLLDKPAPICMTDLKHLGSLTEVHAQAALGQAWATAALSSCQKGCQWEDLAPFDELEHAGLS